MKSNGIIGVNPQIKKVNFESKGYIAITLEDGRIVLCPIRSFPSIRKLNQTDRNNFFILGKGEGIVWEKSDYILHIQDVLGMPKDYIHADIIQNTFSE